MPAVSERKLAANQANARKSTGPTTAAGKAMSRLNALKHGLRAEEVVLPGEDAAAFEAERTAWFEDWQPRSQTRAVLVERAAVLAWRLRRCVRVEAATLGTIAQNAADDYDRRVERRIEPALDLLDQHPLRALDLLLDDPDGIAALIRLWGELAQALVDPAGWTEEGAHHGRLLTLLGHPCHFEAGDTGEDEPLVELSLRLLITNRPEVGTSPDGPLTPGVAREVAATIRAIAHDRMKALRSELDRHEDRDVVRVRHIEASCFDDSDRGRSLQRYEATHDRAFRSTVGQLMAMAKSGIDEAAPGPETEIRTDVAPDRAGAAGPVESLPNEPRNDGPPEPNKPTETKVGPAPNEPTEPAPKPRTSGRDRGGRTWPVGSEPGPAEAREAVADQETMPG